MIVSQYPGLCRRPCRRHNLRLGVSATSVGCSEPREPSGSAASERPESFTEKMWFSHMELSHSRTFLAWSPQTKHLESGKDECWHENITSPFGGLTWCHIVTLLPCYLSHFPMKPLGSLGLPSWWRCHWSVCGFLSHFNLAKCNCWKLLMCKRCKCTDMTNWDKLDTINKYMITYIYIYIYIHTFIMLQFSSSWHVWKCSEVLLICSPYRPSCHTPKGVIFFGHALD